MSDDRSNVCAEEIYTPRHTQTHTIKHKSNHGEGRGGTDIQVVGPTTVVNSDGSSDTKRPQATVYTPSTHTVPGQQKQQQPKEMSLSYLTVPGSSQSINIQLVKRDFMNEVPPRSA